METLQKVNRTTSGGKAINNMSSFVSSNRDNDIAELSKGLFSISPHQLEVEPGFNTRTAGMDDEEFYALPEMAEYIDSLALSYKEGRFVEPISVVVKDGHVYVRQGHFRRRGLLRAINHYNADIKSITVIEFTGDEVAQEVHTITGNDGMKMSAVAIAASLDRLISYGWKLDDIAKLQRQTTANVKKLLLVNCMPIELKRMIADSTIKHTLAIEMYETHGTATVEKVKAALQKCGGKGKVRKTMLTMPPMSRKVATMVRSNYVTLMEKFIEQSKEQDEGDEITIRVPRSLFNESSDTFAGLMAMEERQRRKILVNDGNVNETNDANDDASKNENLPVDVSAANEMQFAPQSAKDLMAAAGA